MRKTILNNDRGFVLITSLLMLMVLMIIGIAATDSTNIELQISANDKVSKQTFYVAESGWQVTVVWLDSQYPLPTENMGMDTSSGIPTFSAAKYAAPDSLSSAGGTAFESKFDFGSATSVAGYSTDFKRYEYTINSSATGAANSKASIAVNAGKIEYVGGY